MKKEARPNLAWPLVLVVAGLGLFVVACGGGSDSPASDAPGGYTAPQQHQELPTIEVQSLWAWGDAAHLETLINSADVVFRGNVVALKGQRPVLSQPGGTEASATAPRWADMPVSQFDVGV